MHTESRIVYDFHTFMKAGRNANVRNTGQGDFRYRKYKRLKLGGGQAYGRSSD
jgi:hypothetical protein